MPQSRKDDFAIDKGNDDILSLQLLAGLVRSREAIATEFPKHNSAQEKKCRAALARIVRSRVQDFWIGEFLALAIDPDTPSRIPGVKPPRRIRFQSPARGLPSTAMRDLWIAALIRNLTIRGVKKEAALKSAEEAYGINRSTALAACRRYSAAFRATA